MANLSIYFKDNSEQTEFESQSKGYRDDIFVKMGDQYFQVTVYDIVRLKQDFETEIEQQGFFSIDPNVILVEQVTTGFIKKTIIGLYKQKYFERIKPLLLNIRVQDLTEIYP